MNIVILTGRLTRDPTLQYTQNGKAYARFSLAVKQDFKNEKGEYNSDFINCQVWDKKAETVGEYLRKGSMIGVEGRLSVRSYEDENKQKKTITEVVVNKFEFLDSKKKQEEGGEVIDNPGDDEFPF